MIVKDRQAEQELRRHAPNTSDIAVVGGVYPDGIALIFAGENTESAKHYAYNGAVKFSPGQRVHLVRVAGTYIVEYPIL